MAHDSLVVPAVASARRSRSPSAASALATIALALACVAFVYHGRKSHWLALKSRDEELATGRAGAFMIGYEAGEMATKQLLHQQALMALGQRDKLDGAHLSSLLGGVQGYNMPLTQKSIKALLACADRFSGVKAREVCYTEEMMKSDVQELANSAPARQQMLLQQPLMVTQPLVVRNFIVGTGPEVSKDSISPEAAVAAANAAVSYAEPLHQHGSTFGAAEWDACFDEPFAKDGTPFQRVRQLSPEQAVTNVASHKWGDAWKENANLLSRSFANTARPTPPAAAEESPAPQEESADSAAGETPAPQEEADETAAPAT